MIESIMIEYCVTHGMVYVDYYVNRAGRIIFVGKNSKKYRSYIVQNWRPFRCTPFEQVFRI